jgi:2-polyprenyl-6-methoxyphenol hydroxylase-like FAD-dependent oxidoreductase
VARIAVIGAGIAGLGIALTAGRKGHEVVLVERDDTPMPTDAHGAFDWDRRGAPQVRHSHAFLARLRNLLRDRHPDVLDALYRAGATPMDFISMLPDGMDRTPMPGDEDLVAIACRRTTFEWVLRHTVLEEGSATLVHGVGVTGLRADPAAAGRPPLVTGVELSDGRALDADVVIAAGGRRNDLPALLAAIDVELPQTIEDTGIVYFSRFFRLRDGAEYPPQSGPIGGDLGYLKFGVFQGDNRTYSVTLAAGVDDTELRRRLLDPDEFQRAAASVPATAAHVEADRAEPITEVNVMAGLLNRRREFTDDDGAPRVLGLHAVGDAHTCTNPLYGRGCSLAVVQAELFADALDAHGLDHDARARAYETASGEQITPWYRAAVAQDRMARRAAAKAAAAEAAGPDADDAPASTEVDPQDFARELLRDGLLPAMRVDPVVLRAFLRMFNLLEAPDSLMNDADVIGRVMAVFSQRDERPPEAPLGPDRAELLSLTA